MKFSPERLKSILATREITQKKLSLYVNISECALNAKLNGRRRFNVDEIASVCTYLKITPSELFTD